jgi:hypothetical protein
VGYLQVDEENRLLWCNEQARQLLQIDRWEPGQLRLLLELVRSYELDQLIEQTRYRQQPDIREWVFHPPAWMGQQWRSAIAYIARLQLASPSRTSRCLSGKPATLSRTLSIPQSVVF